MKAHDLIPRNNVPSHFRSSTFAPPQPLFNIVLRAAMEKLQLKLINRDYFDPKAAVPFSQHKLELWPGCVYRFNSRMALDKPHSARALLLNEKRHSRMARVERGSLDTEA